MNTPAPRSSVLLVTIALAACATARPAANPTAAPPATTSAPAANAPHESAEEVLARLLAPEATAELAPQTIAIPGGDLRLAGHGTGAATVTPQGEQFQVVMPIGGVEPLRCIVFHEGIDLANGLRTVFENARQANANLELHGMDAGFVGDSPYLDLQALYLVGEGNQRALGHLKMRAFNVGDRGVVCLHDQPGFVATFDRATRPMIDASAHAPRPARYLISLGGHPCGYTVINTTAAAGVTTEVNMSGYLLARDAHTLIAADEVTIEHYNRAGELADARVVNNHDTSESNYLVRRAGTARRYHVEGRHEGHDIAGDINAATPLVGGTPAMARAWRTLTGARAPATVEVLGFSTDTPLAASTQSYRLDRAVDAQHAWIIQHAGDVDLRTLVGASGVPDEINIGEGERALIIRRVAD